MSEANLDRAALVGLRLTTRTADADLYCINMYNSESDYYLSAQGNIVIISDVSLALELVAFLHRNSYDMDFEPTEPEVIYDLPEALRLITSQNADDNSVILNCLNAILDLVTQVGCSLPDRARRDLQKLADHLTFNREFGSFLLVSKLTRNEVRNAICMCVGMIVPYVCFVDKEQMLLFRR